MSAATSEHRMEMMGASVLGRYRIVARLAQGGMGVVYLARAEGAAGFAKPVVVKRILPDLTGDAKMARLFVREAKILSNLQHPNIVGVIDFGEEDSAYIMVLDYVRAYHLGLWLSYRSERKELFPVAGVLHIVIKVLDALAYAHALTLPDGSPLEIIHADISPQNILVDTDGQVKLLDFGIARMRGESTQSTDGRSIRGKFSYLPVEALDGSPPKVATDVYACAVTLYELLTGQNPFTGVDETRTIARVISHEPPPPSSFRPDLPAGLDEIVARAMSKDPSKRFASAKDFARELRRVQTVPEDEAATALATIAKSDYAAMPARPGASIAELEDAWRNAPVSAPGTEAGDATAALASASTASPRKRNVMMLAVMAGALVLASAGGTALWIARRSEPETPNIVLVEKNATATATVASASGSAVPSGGTPEDPRPPASVAAREDHAPSAVRPAAAPAKPSGDPLSAALAKNQPEIEACFRDKAADLAGNPEVSVRFTIDKEGAVQRAEIAPAELGSVPLGQCILAVAKRTRFPAQASEPVSFRIPLRARKVQ